MKIIFLGTPEFGAIVLNNLINSEHEIVAVVTGTDKSVGRGNKIQFSPVKIVALNHNLPLFQFEKIRKDGTDVLKNLNADIMITAAYGQIISQEIIDICPLKVINVHGSVLPKYRGATPIQSAIYNGDKITGVTIMNTDIGIDTGDILATKTVEICDDDNYQTLSVKLANEGSKILLEVLKEIEVYKKNAVKQNEKFATYTKMIKKQDEQIDFNNKAIDVCNKIRAYFPSPVATFMLNANNFKVKSAKSLENYVCAFDNPKVGQIVEANSKKGLIIKCKEGFIELIEIQAPNSKMMSAKSYLNGKKLEIGSVCNG